MCAYKSVVFELIIAIPSSIIEYDWRLFVKCKSSLTSEDLAGLYTYSYIKFGD